jgi:predicted aspartyl protease
MRVPFSHALYPPAPALEVRLLNPVSGQRTPYQHAILDTGSDTTIVPVELLYFLEVKSFRQQRVLGLWGGEAMVDLYYVNFEISGSLFTRIEVIGSDTESEILIGRNLCNQLRLLLDGPDQTVELFE